MNIICDARFVSSDRALACRLTFFFGREPFNQSLGLVTAPFTLVRPPNSSLLIQQEGGGPRFDAIGAPALVTRYQ